VKLFGSHDAKGELIIEDPYYDGIECFEKGRISIPTLK